MKKFNLLCEDILQSIATDKTAEPACTETIGTYELEHYTLNINKCEDGSYTYELFQDNGKLLTPELNKQVFTSVPEAVEAGVIYIFDWSDYIGENYDINDVIAQAQEKIK